MKPYRYALEALHPEHWHMVGDEECVGPRKAVGLCMHTFAPLRRRSEEPPRANLCLGCLSAAQFRDDVRREIDPIDPVDSELDSENLPRVEFGPKWPRMS
jgi:hypothetical protein